MSNDGVPVPPGVVLPVAFFTPWFDAIKASPGWTELTRAAPEDWGPLCDALKEAARCLPMTASQQETWNALLRALDLRDAGMRFAVRSSSPDEDLESASFAGGYETRLGVHPDDLEDAVRACFVSSLDLRVLSYKQARGFELWSPRIAVIVQVQIDSEIAGVGFSLNPLNNDYDEALIEANWGLGSSVVEGRASPDRFVVDKVDRRVVDVSLGAKQFAAWLDAERGTVERPGQRSSERTLSDAQLLELTELIGRIEKLFAAPVDIEWAYAGARLHVLQARPITRFVPLPAEMLTAPGQPRRLYADAALSKGLTSNAPISSLGLDAMKSMFSTMLETWVGRFNREPAPEDALIFFAGSRMYMNCSNILWLASPQKLARSTAPTDALMARILADVDPKRYRAARRPAWLSVRLLWIVPRGLWNLRGFFWNLLFALLAPQRAHRVYRRKIDAFESELRAQLDDGSLFDDFRHSYEARMARELFGVMMAAVLVGTLSPALIFRARRGEDRELVARLGRGTTGNVVVEMGIALYRLAGHLDRSEPGRSRVEDWNRLAERIEQRALSPEWMKQWDGFLSRFGWRGPMEMDLASPRYADAPGLAVRQMALMAVDERDCDPEAAHRRHIEQRRQAWDELMRRVGPLRRALLRRIHRLNELFAGARDTPKHLLVLFNYAIRKRALAEGRRLLEAGRLDTAEDVFALRFADLAAAAEDASLDLRELRDQRSQFRNQLAAKVKSFPAVIDSRGRILRAPVLSAEPGLLRGMPVSPGVVTGPVRRLHSPHDKAVVKGDVLVAYATDPGWTPLFVNAAAVVLEVGGVLQHGAVIAREYGKPCVTGIDRLVETLRDGELVEVDGTAGTVRRLSQSDGE